MIVAPTYWYRFRVAGERLPYKRNSYAKSAAQLGMRFCGCLYGLDFGIAAIASMRKNDHRGPAACSFRSSVRSPPWEYHRIDSRSTRTELEPLIFVRFNRK